MIKDREGHAVKLCREGNGHVLIYGNSGQGKTYFLCRMLEEYCREKKRTLILDFSGSYTVKELREKGFMYQKDIKRYDLREVCLPWVYQVRGEDLFQNDIADALTEILECRGYYQKKLLMEAIARTMKREEMIQISGLLGSLEEMLLEEESGEKKAGNVDNLNRLLTRLFPYKDIINFELWNRYTVISRKFPVTIIDMTAFPEGQRKFLTKLLVSLLWREIYRQENRNRCDVLLLDEMQFLPVNDDSTLASMLREGRKRGLELLLSTQFLSNYNEAEKSALMQADTKIIFRPTPEDYKYSAQIIEPMNPRIGMEILSGLSKGEAALKGHYKLDERKKVASKTIVIRASLKEEIAE